MNATLQLLLGRHYDGALTPEQAALAAAEWALVMGAPLEDWLARAGVTRREDAHRGVELRVRRDGPLAAGRWRAWEREW